MAAPSLHPFTSCARGPSNNKKKHAPSQRTEELSDIYDRSTADGGHETTSTLWSTGNEMRVSTTKLLSTHQHRLERCTNTIRARTSNPFLSIIVLNESKKMNIQKKHKHRERSAIIAIVMITRGLFFLFGACIF